MTIFAISLPLNDQRKLDTSQNQGNVLAKNRRNITTRTESTSGKDREYKGLNVRTYPNYIAAPH